jgi:hypothetical protein
MPLHTPSSNAGRVLPFEPRPRVARSASWPFPAACEPAAPQVRAQAARVIATTARHWLGLA